MKKLILPYLILLLAACGGSDGNRKVSTDIVTNPATADSSNMDDDAGTAVIQFEKTMHDFGTLTEGEVLEYDFRFTNTGKQDLLIASSVASCGCTVADYPKEPIKPGGQGRIKIKFDSEKRSGAFQKQVTITANTTPPETVIMIKGVVKDKPSAQPAGGIH